MKDKKQLYLLSFAILGIWSLTRNIHSIRRLNPLSVTHSRRGGGAGQHFFFLSNIGDKDIYDEYHDSSDEANDDMIVTTPCNSRLFSMS